MESGIAFISTHFNLSNYKPTKLLENHTFRKATFHESERIRNLLIQYAVNPAANHKIPYEISNTHGENGKVNTTLLVEDEWKYWVVAYNGYNHEFQYIEQAFLLLKNSLSINLHLIFKEKIKKEK